MKKWIGIGCLTAIVSLMFMAGCDSDSGTEWDGTIFGKWEAVKEVLTIKDTGKMTLTPSSIFFIHLIIEINEDSTYQYEMWTGQDKTAEGADYSNGTGEWSSDGGNTFSMVLGDSAGIAVEGTWKASDTTLIISSNAEVEKAGMIITSMEINFTRLED